MEHRRGPSLPIPHLETSSLPNGELSVPCLPPILWYRLQEAELPKTGCPFYRPYFALGQLRHPDIHWPAQSCRRSSPSLSVTLRFADSASACQAAMLCFFLQTDPEAITKYVSAKKKQQKSDKWGGGMGGCLSSWGCAIGRFLTVSWVTSHEKNTVQNTDHQAGEAESRGMHMACKNGC